MESLDCVVIGAGWYGLGAAKQYHCIRPHDSIAVFDSQSTLGGTWADERLYPGLKTNNLLGTYEFPDFPMDSDRFGIQTGQHIPGNVVNAYLKAYAANFGIADFIRLQTKVLSAEHQTTDEGGWILTVADSKQEESRVFARRLIVATGLTSEAISPHFDGQETFGGNIFHGKNFLQNRDTLDKTKSVTIFGGTKYAWDAVYTYVEAGVKVDWVIRSSGHGPCWMAPPHVTPFKKWLEMLVNTRFMTWFSPCIWGDADGYSGVRQFLHGTAIGRLIVNSFWKVLGNDVLKLNAYHSHPETAKLKPWIEAMFAGTSFSILNYDTNFFDLVKSDKVRIHVGEVDHLSPGKVHLADGTVLASDAILAHTGWKQVPPIKFLPEGIDKDLGIPHLRQDNAPREDLANQTAILERADDEILARFPRLRNQPVWNKDYIPLTDSGHVTTGSRVPATEKGCLTSYMLYHFMVPPTELFLRPRDIVFVGQVGNFSGPLTAHLQGLWAAAYFCGLLKNDPASAVGDEASMQALQHETVLHNRFGKWRYPTDWGNRAPSFVFDAVPYFDLLQRDLGLDPHRKHGFKSEIWDSYGPEDYANINDEWNSKIMNKAETAS